MGRVTTWSFGVSTDRAVAGTVTDALRTAGVTVEQDAQPSSGSVGLALISEASPSVLTRLRSCAAAGWERIIALMLDGRTLPLEESLSLLDVGVSDVIAWGEPASGVQAVLARLARYQTVERLMCAPAVRNNLVGESSAWRNLLRRLVEVGHFTSASILLAGESGTGKELAARLIHTLDARRDKRDLVVLDCATIVPELSGSEFFGHERGAFTGASHPREGAFELANGGTLFLDEVGDLPLPLQAQLLRVVQEQTYKRVGGNQWQRTEFRLVCASHRNLAEAVERGEFRHDLYHRIATWTFSLPPLRDRIEDILPLARHFAEKNAPSGQPLLFDASVERYLVGRAYPGNIRELLHTVNRLIHRYPGEGPITVGQIPEEERGVAARAAAVWPDDEFAQAVRRALVLGVGLKSIGKTAEDLAVQVALALESGSVTRASRRLGITDRALQLRQAQRREVSEKENTLD